MKLLQRVRFTFKRFLLGKEILVLGDSHASVFSHRSLQLRFSKYYFKVISVAGATASGLENPNSKTQAYPRFMEALKKSKARKVIVLLGEVDAGFVIWYRAKKYQSPVAAMMEEAVKVYGQFLKEVSLEREVICISAPLPTIPDGKARGEVADARREITAAHTQLERTGLTLEFNRRMQSFCQGAGIRYLMLDGKSVGENGLVKRELLRADPTNHHYNRMGYSSLIIEELAGALA